MGQQDRLKSLADNELLAELAAVVRKRNAVNAELLAYLAELDERRLFLDLGFPSLFAFCVESLGLSEATAGRYISVARVCRTHPDAFALVARGELHASALSLMKPHLTSDNAAELFTLCSRQSARQVELLLAARYPKPDVRDAIRRLPNSQSPTRNVESAAQTACPEPTRTARAAAPALPAQQKLARIQPLAAERYGVHFTADGEFRQLLERVRGLAGHRLPSGDLLTLIKRGLEAYERELAKKRFAIGGKPRAKRATAQAPTGPNGSASAKRRHLAASVRRAVFTRDGGQCTFVAADWRRCEARGFLELDHIQPRALGGEDSVENLRLLCKAHNLHAARRAFGRTYLRASITRSRMRSLSQAQSRPASSSKRFMSSSSSVR
jgi:HNH endonuclease